MQRLFAVLLALSAAACTKANTEIVVWVDADFPVTSLETALRAAEGAAPIDAHTFAAPTLPLSFGVRPIGGDPAKPIVIEVLGRGAGAEVVQRTVITGFVADKTTLLRVTLHQECQGLSCASGSTCIDGPPCAGNAILASSLPVITPGDELKLDAGPRDDAAASDVPEADAGQPDVPGQPDAAPVMDAADDAGAPDLGADDAALGDALGDAGPDDGGSQDAAPLDAAAPDASAPDATFPDAAPVDAGPACISPRGPVGPVAEQQLGLLAGNRLPPAVAMDAAGNAVAIWSFADPMAGARDIFFSRFNGSWSPAALIGPVGFHQYSFPAVALNPDGRGLAAWHRSGPYDVFASLYDGASWAAPLQLTNDNSSLYPRAAAGGGYGMVVWSRSLGGHPEVWGAVYNFNNSTWAPPTVISASGVAAATYDVAMNALGHATVVFEEGTTPTTVIRARAFDPLGNPAWGPIETIQTRGHTGHNPKVSLSGGDEATAVWTTDSMTAEANHRGPSGWDPAGETRIDAGFGLVYKVAVGSSDCGDAAAVMVQSDNLNVAGTFAARYWGAAGWQPAVRIDNGGAGDSPAVVMGPDGSAVASWVRIDTASSMVMATSLSATGSWTPAFRVSGALMSQAGTDAEDPALAYVPAAGAFVVNSIYDRTQNGVESLWCERLQ